MKSDYYNMKSTILTIIVVIFVVNVRSVSIDNEPPATDLLPQKIGTIQTLLPDIALNDEDKLIFYTKEIDPSPKKGKTSDTDLTRASLLQKSNNEKFSTTLVVINLNAVKNKTAGDLNDVLYNDVIKELPEETNGRLPFILLIIKDADGNFPISLDEVAKDLEGEGFAVEKVVKDGEIRLIKVNLDLVKTTEEISNKSNTSNNALQQKTKIQECGVLQSTRRKRNACFKCTIVVKQKPKRGLRRGHGKCKSGCAGSIYYYPQPTQPVYHQIVYQTIYQYPQSYYPSHQYSQPKYYVQPQRCTTCGGGYGNSGGTSYAQASAQASASASSGSYGR